jgi:hypothetical protein
VDTLLDEWALKVYTGIQTWLGENTSVIDPRDIELEVLVGKKYAKPLQERGVFDRLTAPGSVSVTFPFQDEIDYSNGGGIGTQRSWMCEQVEAQQESATSTLTDGGEPTPDIDDDQHNLTTF